MASSKVSASDMQMRKYVRRQLKKRGVTPTPKLEERSARERRLRKKFREEYKMKNAPKAGPKPTVGDAKDRIKKARPNVGDAKDRRGSKVTQNPRTSGSQSMNPPKRVTENPRTSGSQSMNPPKRKTGSGFDAKDRRTSATGNSRSRVGDAKDRMRSRPTQNPRTSGSQSMNPPKRSRRGGGRAAY